jgi:8-oxo-dGTP pyrophosphatase MutT (NUDIX family)
MSKESKEIKHLTCDKECCKYAVIPYKNVYYSNNIHSIQTKIKKAGCFIYNKSGKILLVQSRGQMWGPPKGTIKPDESVMECALREVQEETGIVIDALSIHEDNSVVISSKACYFFLEKEDEDEKKDILPQVHIHDNDANGIGWFHINCLNTLIQQGKIFINQHCRILIKKVFNIDIIFN